ncbi:hypothetical protein HX881_03750 [Pseudomonas gingeri]|nr:hypothetical protein [Pseudomonas gingeri]NVZ24651.1 hypothetical protein [Pseudomonas gingeri]
MRKSARMPRDVISTASGAVAAWLAGLSGKRKQACAVEQRYETLKRFEPD